MSKNKKYKDIKRRKDHVRENKTERIKEKW